MAKVTPDASGNIEMMEWDAIRAIPPGTTIKNIPFAEQTDYMRQAISNLSVMRLRGGQFLGSLPLEHPGQALLVFYVPDVHDASGT